MQDCRSSPESDRRYHEFDSPPGGSAFQHDAGAQWIQSGGPDDRPEGTRYNGWTGEYEPLEREAENAATTGPAAPRSRLHPSETCTPSSLTIDPALARHTTTTRQPMESQRRNVSMPSSISTHETPTALKRRPPPLAMMEGLQVVQKVKLSSGGSRGRTRSADFDKMYASLIHLAVGHYQAILCNVSLYPNDVQRRDWSAEAWVKACREKGVKMDFDEDGYKLITSRGSNIRSDLKSAVRLLIEAEYGFVNNSTSTTVIQANARLARELLSNRKNLAWKDRLKKTGLYEADIILRAITKWCYEKKTSLGVKYPSYFRDPATGGAPFGIIAAVLTGIEACVSEWVTGIRTESRFHEEQHMSIFADHYRLIANFHEGTKDANIMPRICKRLLKHTRRHGNVSEEVVTAPIHEEFSESDFAAATAEWEGREDSDDDADTTTTSANRGASGSGLGYTNQAPYMGDSE
ncbi:hypothetical protein HYDPIDRAFT_32975 [Hydnomerulius pinastri MD-312]|uniref:Unplaced genomic scaffold scaffold_49, whole genome shotgun sequence n=1 Tax=Hydnomerulius pinastri MD-312 TaxID=994086 RepID=A0A0C9V2Z9_9AGAM|nr:hypothetical protein HYDPIDRAFT_32975 [Hydnomerulius pinastri MD-312]